MGRIFRETGSIREGFDSYPELKMSSVVLSAVAKRALLHKMGFVFEVLCRPIRFHVAKFESL